MGATATSPSAPGARTTDGAAERIDALVAGMTLVEKAAQMTQVEFNSITPDEVARYGIGSVLSGGGGNPGDGSARAWRDHVESYVAASRRSRLGIPILYGTDAVHGHNNVLGATIFPHHIGLGAIDDVDVVRRVSRASALETAATGARWSFAPCLAVPQDIRWGRTYEGFSQDPDVVARLGRASVVGWHGDDPVRDGVLACPKHYVGEGAMVWGSAGSYRHDWIDWWDGWGDRWQIDQGDIVIDEDELREVHLRPFVDAVEAGAMSVMACYASWRGDRLHGHRYLLTDVLKGELGFDGFVVSDWMAVDQLAADHHVAVERAIDAGIDMVMVPFDYERFISTVLDLVDDGRLAEERLDDAVRRILRAKASIGLLDGDGPGVPLDVVGCSDHRDLARSAARSSVVPLTDRGGLPIPAGARVLAAGRAIDDLGIGCGGWTISWDGGTGAITAGATVLDGLRRLHDGEVRYEPDGRFGTDRGDVGVVTLHELPYVEGGGDRADLRVPDDQIEVVRRVRRAVDRLVVLVVSGRPLLIEPVPQLADSVLACWLPGSEADGVAEALLSEEPPRGRLPVQWPRSVAHVTGDTPVHGEPAPWPVGHRAGHELTGTKGAA